MIDYSMLGELDNRELLIAKGIQAIECLMERIGDPSEKGILQHAIMIGNRELEAIRKQEKLLLQM